MSEIVLPIIIGLLLLGILFYWLLREENSGHSQLEYLEAHSALTHLQSVIVSPDLVEKITSERDLAFVYSEGEPNLISLFISERRAASILWLRRMRHEVKLLMHFHVKSARYSASLGPVGELKLALQFFVFNAIYCGLFTLVWLRGPFHTRKFVNIITTALGDFCSTSHQALLLASSGHAGAPQESTRDIR